MMKNDRGVALATLVIAVLVMLTITGSIAYTSLDTMKLRKLDDMYNDIRLLNQKVTNYYMDNNDLPVLGTVISKNDLPEEIKNNNENDGYEYRIIDLGKLGGITLKYGKEYKEYATNKTDIYIINEVSHTIYYLKGIKINEEGINVEKYALEETYTEIPGVSILPSGYEKLEYIESTGTQYLEIDFIANQDTKAKGKYQITNITGAAGMLFGSRVSVSKDFYGLNWGGALPWTYYNSYYDAYLINTSKIDNNVHTFYKNKNELYIDDTLIDTQEPETFTTPYNMIIFGCNTNGAIGLFSSARIYELQFYENDTLKIDLVPCYCRYDNEIGMYDIVNNRFYTNLGTGKFVTPNNDN